MTILKKIINSISNGKYIIKYIRLHSSNLYFDTWIYSDTLKISDRYILRTPDVYFEVIKYHVLSDTKYRFNLIGQSKIIEDPKHATLFNYFAAPSIFRACAKEYKKTGKQK